MTTRSKTIWRNTITGETGEWPYTGQDADEMAREARCYAEHVPGMEYLVVKIEDSDPEETISPKTK